jgi:pyruvate/2-oxoglutarate dehydrogenase complex dihydrolipoamide dehydrogenase (E3) component
LPSKNVIRSAKVADLMFHANAYGVRTASATVDMEGVRRRKREMVDGLIATHRKKFAVPNLEFLLAEGRLVGPRTVEATLAEGGQRGIEVRVAMLPMTSVLRARAIGETRGFMKMLIDPKSQNILGFTMLGSDAGEVLAVVQAAMLGGLPYPVLRDAILTHPTMAEGLNVLLTSGIA